MEKKKEKAEDPSNIRQKHSKSLQTKKTDKEKPFSDCFSRGRMITGWVNPKTGWLSSEDILQGIKDDPGRDSEKLRVLVWVYQSHLEKAQQEALSHFWNVVEDFVKGGYITHEEWKLLCEAEAVGTTDETKTQHIKAVQELVKANPLTINLPFIANAMINILREYKNTFTSKTDNENKIYGEDLKLKWEGFLPSRKKIPYSRKDIIEAIRAIQKEENINKEKAYNDVAEALNIGVEPLKKIVRKKN